MNKAEVTISYFKPRLTFNTSLLKFTCFRMASANVMMVGTKNGGIIAYQLDPNSSAKVLIDFQQPCKLPILRIDCLGDCYNLLLFVDGSLYYYNTGTRKAKEMIRGTASYEIMRVDNKMFIFAAVKNKILKYNAEELFDNNRETKKDLHLVKEYTFDNTIKHCVPIGNHIVVSLLTREVMFLDLQTLQSRDANLLKTDELIIHNLASNEVLILMKYDKQNYIGIFFDDEGTTAKTRNSINLTLKDRMTRVISNNQFIVISSVTESFVYNLHDNRLLQKLDEVEVKNNPYFDFFDDNLFAITENTIVSFTKTPIPDIIKEVKTRLIYSAGVSLLKAAGSEASPQQLERQIVEVYNHCAWTLLTTNKFEEASDCFAHINFDPIEILETVIEQYNIDVKFEILSYPDQLKKFIKDLFLKKRAEVLREGENSIIKGSTIVRRRGENQDVKAKDWLAVIDYAYIRACIELGEFNELFDFLRKNETVYCDDRNKKLSSLFIIVEHKQSSAEIKLALLSELSIILGNRLTALENLKILALSEKIKTKFDFDKYARSRASELLILSQRDDKFFELILEHFEWLAADFEVIKSFFKALEVESRIVEHILNQIDKLELEKVRYAIKSHFLQQLIARDTLHDLFINGEYFVTQLNLFKLAGDVNTLIGADHFIQDENREFDFKILLIKFREIQSKLLLTYDKNDSVRSLLLKVETHILKRINTRESHQEALDLMIKLEQFSLAEDYCGGINFFSTNRRTSFKTNDGKGRIFLLNQLLEIYVRMYKQHKSKDTYIKLISDFLKKFAGNPNLDASNVIKLLPDDFKVNDIKFDFFGFIDATFTELNAKNKEMLFKKNISESYFNTVSYELAMKQKRWVRVDDESYCFKCGNKIMQKVFDVFPNGVVIDHFCMNELKDKDKCPITMQNFKKTNFI